MTGASSSFWAPFKRAFCNRALSKFVANFLEAIWTL